jgi:EAL domain-containing protein (putative c-di-GMP-specific phosphodiesterase class I)
LAEDTGLIVPIGDWVFTQAVQQARSASASYSLASAPDNFIVHVPSQVVTDVPANIPHALLPEYLEGLIRERSPEMRHP